MPQTTLDLVFTAIVAAAVIVTVLIFCKAKNPNGNNSTGNDINTTGTGTVTGRISVNSVASRDTIEKAELSPKSKEHLAFPFITRNQTITISYSHVSPINTHGCIRVYVYTCMYTLYSVPVYY